MAHPGMQALAVLGRGTPGGAESSTDYQWYPKLASRHIVNLGSLVYDLVHRQPNEITKHNVDDGAHTGHSRSNPKTADAGLRDGRIDHALRAEFLNESREYFEWRPRFGDILTHDKNGRISAQLFSQGFADRLTKGDLAHVPTLYVCPNYARHRHVQSPRRLEEMVHSGQTPR